MSTIAKNAKQTSSEKERGNELHLEFSNWMSKPILQSMNLLTELVDGFEFVVPLDSCIICSHIPIVDSLYGDETKSKYMFTLYGANNEKVYYISTAQNNKARKIFAFKYRFIDQYERHIVSVRKLLCFLSNRIAEIHSPPGKRVADVFKVKHKDSTEYRILKHREPYFAFQQVNDKTFNIMKQESKIGSITNVTQNVRQSTKMIDSKYIRVEFPVTLLPKEKIFIISVSLIVNLYHFGGNAAIF